jgi:iron complex outermembrane recepter protein
MKFIYFILLLILLNVAANAQYTISGSVTNKETNESLPGVNIYIADMNTGAVSNTNGNFKINSIPAGFHKIQFSFVGYETRIVPLFITKDTSIALSLEKTVVEGHEVIISAAYQTTQDENPVKVEQLTASNLFKSGSVTLMEGISTIPGISQVSTGVGIGKPVIRGLSYNRVLVYSMGVRIENQQWGDEHGLGLNDMGIERVEIIKGPSSLLYGSEAMGGVMHMIPEKPAVAGTIKGDFQQKYFSNTNGLYSTAGVSGATNKVRFGLRAGGQTHSDYLSGADYRATNTRFNDFGTKSYIGLNHKQYSGTISHQYISSGIGIPDSINEQSTEKHIEGNYQQIQSHLISSQNTFFQGNSKIKFNAGYIQNQRLEFESEEEAGHSHEGEAGDPALNMLLRTLNYDLKWYLPPQKNAEFIVGVQGMVQKNKNEGEEVLIPDATQSETGAVVMVKFDFNKANIQAGMRYDIRKINVLETFADSTLLFSPFSVQFNSFNGSLGGSYRPGKRTVLRFNTASGYRAPNLSELASNGVHHGTLRYETGNNDLHFEQNIEADISGHYHSEHISFDIAGFYNTIFNYIYLNPTDSFIEGYKVFNYTQGNALLTGGEATIDIHPHPFDWLHLESSFSMVNGRLKSGGHLPLIPANKLSNTLRTEFEKLYKIQSPYISITYSCFFRKNEISVFETITQPYNLLNAGLGGKVKLGNQSAEFSININNILNEKYYDHLSRLKYNNIYNIGRNIVVSIKIPFGIKQQETTD